MSFFGKLAFWKKEDDISIGLKIPGLDGESDLMGGLGTQDPSFKGPFDNPEFGKEHVSTQRGVSPFQEGSATMLRENAPNAPGGGLNQQQQNYQAYGASKDMEVISAKLDALRAALDSINQRLANLERIAAGEQEQPKRRWHY